MILDRSCSGNWIPWGEIPYKKDMVANHKFWIKPPRGAKNLFCECELKFFSPLRGIKSETILKVSWSSNISCHTAKAPAEDVLRLNTLGGTKTTFSTPDMYDKHPPSFLWEYPLGSSLLLFRRVFFFAWAHCPRSYPVLAWASTPQAKAGVVSFETCEQLASIPVIFSSYLIISMMTTTAVVTFITSEHVQVDSIVVLLLETPNAAAIWVKLHVSSKGVGKSE